MFMKAKLALQFSARRDDLQNTGFDPVIENRRINFLNPSSEVAGNKAEGSF